MAKNQNQKNNDLYTKKQRLSKANQTKNRGEYINIHCKGNEYVVDIIEFI
jgi:hypothetical protein